MTIRKSSLQLTNAEWDAFIAAFEVTVADGRLAEFVGFHTMNRAVHGAGIPGLWRFLPWHRAYVLEFEKVLQTINSEVSIPYWDWPSQSFIPLKLENYIGLSTGRAPGMSSSGWFPSQLLMDSIMAETNFRQFTNRLEGEAHNPVHMWVGGNMMNMQSPRDPLFWLHHAAVDRYWHLWQQDNFSDIPDALGSQRIMDPWTQHTINSLSDIRQLDYDYDIFVPPPVEPPVQPPVEPPVEPPVQPPVEPPVQPPVEPPVEPPVQPPVEPPVQPPVEPPVQPPVEIAPIVTAMLPYKLRKAYFFKERTCVEYHLHKKEAITIERPISEVFPNMDFTDNIDAIVKWNGGKVYIFRGNQCIRYDLKNRRQDPGFPQLIDEFWPDLGFTTIDAAVRWDRRTAYFFSGSQFVRYNVKSGKADEGFPRLIARTFPGLSFQEDIDAALCHKGKVFFIKGNEYARFDVSQWQQDFGFPRSLNGEWPDMDL